MDIGEYLNKKVPTDKKLCFVIMPFNPILDETYKNCLKPFIETLGFKCKRADENFISTPIVFDVFDEIQKAEYIIADLTYNNANVFYELGIAHALKKKVILIKKKGEKVVFDLSSVRYHEYENIMLSNHEFYSKLNGTIKELKKKKSKVSKEYEELKTTFNNAFLIWKIDKTIILKYEIFLEIVLRIKSFKFNKLETAFLCHAAAYFGKFMKRMVEVSKKNSKAVEVLVSEAANGVYTRVPWRASVMLEYFDTSLVSKAIRDYNSIISNPEIFPKLILNKNTKSTLIRKLRSSQISQDDKNKLSEALKQIESEFREIDSIK